MTDLLDLRAHRLTRWRQTPEHRITEPEQAANFIRAVGMATLFPASDELPNLFHAYTGDPAAKTESEWDSPAGHVYTWRWTLGRLDAGFYTAIVRGRPTWVSWGLLPAIIRLRGELRAPEELHQAGEISENAFRIAQVLEGTPGGVLGTGDLRRHAGFPTGKAERAAYLKAVEELDTRLLLAKVFSTDDEDMRHALVTARYAEHVAAAREMAREEAMDRFLGFYLPNAVYAAPSALARHLKLPEAELRAGLDRLAATGKATAATLPGIKGNAYVWNEQS